MAFAIRQPASRVRGTLRPRTVPMPHDLVDKQLIREMVERWAVWRDAGDWERSPPCGTPTA